MDDKTFKRESVKAKAMTHVEPERADYWHGYRLGLRRARFGEAFVTDAEHELWMTLDDADPTRAARGRGYRDGLAVGEHRRVEQPQAHARRTNAS